MPLQQLQRTRTVRTAGRLDWYRHRAGRAILHHRRRARVWPFHSIKRLHHHENSERYDQKINHQGNEITVVPCHRSRFGRIGESSETACATCTWFQHHEFIGEIQSASDETERWHNHIFHQRVNDSSERRANDEAHRQIERVTFDCKFFEFFPHGNIQVANL